VDDDREDRAATVPMVTRPRIEDSFELLVPPGAGTPIVRVDLVGAPAIVAARMAGVEVVRAIDAGRCVAFRVYYEARVIRPDDRPTPVRPRARRASP
jgi:hypothetical protein